MTSTDSASPEAKLKVLLASSKAVLLDFDGLLADSEPYHYKAYNEVFERYGHSLDPEEYWVEWTSKGKGIAGEIERHDLKLDVDPAELRRQKFEVYSKYCQDGSIRLFPETLSLVQALRARHKLAIASGSWGHDIRAILEYANALEHFPVILGKESAPREKPHPDIFQKAAAILQCPPETCIVLEDALKGLNAATEAGMRCIIIRNRLNADIEFPTAGLIFDSLAQMVAHLNKPA